MNRARRGPNPSEGSAVSRKMGRMSKSATTGGPGGCNPLQVWQPAGRLPFDPRRPTFGQNKPFLALLLCSEETAGTFEGRLKRAARLLHKYFRPIGFRPEKPGAKESQWNLRGDGCNKPRRRGGMDCLPQSVGPSEEAFVTTQMDRRESKETLATEILEAGPLGVTASYPQTEMIDHLTTLSDEDLLAAHRRDPQGPYIAVLVERYERELFNYLRRQLGDASLAEDAFQAAFMQVHLKSDLFEEGKKFRPWLYTLAINRAIDLQRRNRRHNLVSLDRPNRGDDNEEVSLLSMLGGNELNPSERFDLGERMEWVRKAVAALPEQLRSAISLVYFRGMKHREAAVELAVPVGTVKSRLHSAISRLGEAWEADEAPRRSVRPR